MDKMNLLGASKIKESDAPQPELLQTTGWFKSTSGSFCFQVGKEMIAIRVMPDGQAWVRTLIPSDNRDLWAVSHEEFVPTHAEMCEVADKMILASRKKQHWY